MLALSRADLLLENGLELEVGWLPRLVVGSRNARIQRGGKGRLDASAVIHPLEVHGSADRSLGDVHPAGNPHYTYDPRAIRAVAAALGNTLSALDPPHAAAYQQRSAALQAKLKSFAVREAKRFRALPEARRRVVSFHKSFAYLYDWLGLTEVATVEPLPGVPPDPGHVAEVLGVIRRTGAKAIIQQEYYPRRTSDTLARLGKATVVVLPGGVAPNQSIIDYLQSITDAVYAALAK